MEGGIDGGILGYIADTVEASATRGTTALVYY
jgi:hypothetical protein